MEILRSISQEIVNGLTLGSIFILVAAGLTLILGVFGIPHFAHAQSVMLAGYAGYFLAGVAGVPFFPAIVIAALLMVVFGIGVERIAYRPLGNSPMIMVMLVSFAVVIFVENLVTYWWGANYGQYVKFPYSGGLVIGGVSIAYVRLVILLLSILLIGLVYLILKRTKLGLAIQASAQDQRSALLMGVNITRVKVITFVMASAIAGIAGALLCTVVPVTPQMGVNLIFTSFVVVVVGGLGSLPGCVLAGYAIGIAQSLTARFLTGAYVQTAGFAILIIILLVRPQGLFGKSVMKR